MKNFSITKTIFGGLIGITITLLLWGLFGAKPGIETELTPGVWILTFLVISMLMIKIMSLVKPKTKKRIRQ